MVSSVGIKESSMDTSLIGKTNLQICVMVIGYSKLMQMRFQMRYLIENLHDILEENYSVDVVLVPRVNTVDGLTDSHIQKWGWKVDEKGWVNWPDPQWRLYKNSDNIRWINKVHEKLDGYQTMSNLPWDEGLALYHHKNIAKQEKQNEYYDTLV